MRAFVGVTDNDWFAFLSKLLGIDEVNFWQPHAGQPFKALSPGEPFLFKLHHPCNSITGGAFFASGTVLPGRLGSNSFSENIGESASFEMRKITKDYHRDI